MIYFSGVDSIIECEYLSENLSNRVAACNIFVNPDNVKFLIGKIVIINSLEYDYNRYLPILLDNNCKIISRIEIPDFHDSISFEPYILKICSDIVWNGKVAGEAEYSTLNSILDEELCDFDVSSYLLYFPKIDISEKEKVRVSDDSGNLTGFGWVLQQVGVNIKKDTPFVNLDILKSGKILFE